MSIHWGHAEQSNGVSNFTKVKNLCLMQLFFREIQHKPGYFSTSFTLWQESSLWLPTFMLAAQTAFSCGPNIEMWSLSTFLFTHVSLDIIPENVKQIWRSHLTLLSRQHSPLKKGAGEPDTYCMTNRNYMNAFYKVNIPVCFVSLWYFSSALEFFFFKKWCVRKWVPEMWLLSWNQLIRVCCVP